MALTIRSSKRWRAGLLALAAAALGMVAIGLSTSAPAGAATPSMTMTPSSGLSNGQTVTVHGTGYTPNAKNLNVIECPVSGAGQNTCDVSDAKLFQTIGADGSWTVTMTVKSKLGSIDCTKVQCMIDGHEGTSETSGNDAHVILRFGSSSGSGSGSGSTGGSGSGSTGGSGSNGTGTGSGGTGSGGTGSGGTPTGAPTGHDYLGAPRALLALVIAGVGVILLGAGTALHLRRTRTSD